MAPLTATYFMLLSLLVASCGQVEEGMSSLSSSRHYQYDMHFGKILECSWYRIDQCFDEFLFATENQCEDSSNNECAKSFIDRNQGFDVEVSDKKLKQTIDQRTNDLTDLQYALTVFIYLNSQDYDFIRSGSLLKTLLSVEDPLSSAQVAAAVELHGRSKVLSRSESPFYGNVEIANRTEKIKRVFANSLNVFHLRSIKFLNRVNKQDNDVVEGEVLDLLLLNPSYGRFNHIIITKLVSLGQSRNGWDEGSYCKQIAAKGLEEDHELISRFEEETAAGLERELTELLEEVLSAPSK